MAPTRPFQPPLAAAADIPLDAEEHALLRAILTRGPHRRRKCDPKARCTLQNLVARGLLVAHGRGPSAVWLLSQAGWRSAAARRGS